MRYFIITGAARGLGKALVQELSSKETSFVLIDKRELSSSKEIAQAQGSEVFNIRFDLAAVEDIPELSERIFSQIDIRKASSLTLINNAAEVLPLGLVGTHKNEDLIYEVSTDITQYFLLTNEFTKKTQDLALEKRILNISSGAATTTIKGAATYCAAKAAIEMFTRTMGKEQAKKEFPILVAATTPGVIDTDMQVDLRTPPKEVFPPRNQFAALKKMGLLQSPQRTAQKIAKIFEWDKFPNAKVLKYRKDL
ncbi:SDR family NAD(P)-dependent oxidoreductase [Patescibacteria group bacterium]|nr:SDR family NAD(P)-dependent oxidoreductase [Patescibacteria group bacterium]